MIIILFVGELILVEPPIERAGRFERYIAVMAGYTLRNCRLLASLDCPGRAAVSLPSARGHLIHVANRHIAVATVGIGQRHGIGDPLLITFGCDLVALLPHVSGRCSELSHFSVSFLFEG